MVSTTSTWGFQAWWMLEAQGWIGRESAELPGKACARIFSAWFGSEKTTHIQTGQPSTRYTKHLESEVLMKTEDVAARLREEMIVRNYGAENGANGKKLAQTIGVHERKVRQAISHLREVGVPICGTPDSGYFYAKNREELEGTCEFLRSRAMHSLKLESRLRNMSLPQLVGQMTLDVNEAASD